ncbi:HpcH/HpaI aldolase/citrate lyase family protein [Deinococcus sp. Marseille-Q6407]|uniref:HpcH/HpaI aldolase/citrate lyase family protein n=1 Tax=Deinococcus sp. Marseille-Q6407 TaxID=2969223 RepID=UPI0021BE79E5|nr:CoA ester lyase [Deinococcus sp. Marseille-Q6407]
MTSSSWRSVLYVPADNLRALEKARTLGADAVILDLEDAVAPEHKAAAREQVAAALAQNWPCPVLLRLNAPDTPWHREDLALAQAAGPSGVVLPKVETPQLLDNLPGAWPLWAMIETPLGVLRAPEIAAHGRVAGLIAGTNDLARDLHTRPHPERLPLIQALSLIVLAARAHGRVPLDAVYNNVRDDAGFQQECRQGRDLGFAGKTVIHPSQVQAANQEFGVTDTEAEQARALLAAWEAARAEGRSVATFGGALVEQLHADAAQDLLKSYARQAEGRGAVS